jgi:hypothetical protein
VHGARRCRWRKRRDTRNWPKSSSLGLPPKGEDPSLFPWSLFCCCNNRLQLAGLKQSVRCATVLRGAGRKTETRASNQVRLERKRTGGRIVGCEGRLCASRCDVAPIMTQRVDTLGRAATLVRAGLTGSERIVRVVCGRAVWAGVVVCGRACGVVWFEERLSLFWWMVFLRCFGVENGTLCMGILRRWKAPNQIWLIW